MSAQAVSLERGERMGGARAPQAVTPSRRASALIAARGSGRFARWHFGAPSEAESDENWLLSYLDLFTLLLAMLVVMLGLSRMSKPPSATDEPVAQTMQVPLAAMVASAASTPAPATTALHTALPPVPDTLTPGGNWAPVPDIDRPGPVVWVKDAHTPNATVAPTAAPAAEHQGAPLVSVDAPVAPLVATPPPADPEPPSLQALGLDTLGSSVDVIVNEKTISLRISSELLFPSGQAALGPAGSKVIKSIADALQHNAYEISVEGHSDAISIQNKQFASNWELSSGRASSVLRELINDGISSERLRAVGYAHTRPLASNDSADGRAANRRVELILAIAPGQAAPGGLPVR
ncbi:OmpA family protein [Alcaligenaceae bacterium C4P045]|nr:OmpA family protein [Alcaligenaceae bacterium C4P045]